LVYDPNTLDLGTIQLGVTTAAEVVALLEQGGGAICASLDVDGAATSVIECATCDADAGTLTADNAEACLENGEATVSATANNDAVVPVGFETAFVLTEGAGLVIVQTATTPSFTVTAAGDYRVHTLVYDPNTLDLGTIQLGVTTAAEVVALLEQGGGAICASLDVDGASTAVAECPACTADAGTLTATASRVCLEGGGATVSAVPNGDALVPLGFTRVYLLAEEPGSLVVELAGSPSFTIAFLGDYRIHKLVHDPATLDLSVVPLTTIGALEALLEQGGGAICASLDVVGAAVSVIDCPGCAADAGTMAPVAAEVCLSGGEALLSAVPNGDALVPSGFSQAYVLTEGLDLVITRTGTAPSFTVTAIGDYRVHSLVYDPNTLDLGTIIPGVTTAAGVEALLEQGGGTICGSLDMVGAAIQVIDCPACDADAGTLTANASQVCLDGGSATVSATANGDAVVPPGYETTYLLSRDPGLVIAQTSAMPSFLVTAIGGYRIHTLVYDPNTLDPGTIQSGVTTVAEVAAQLPQGGGTICGSLDGEGARITVVTCTGCFADAGTMTATPAQVCLQGGSATVAAMPNGDAVVPAGFGLMYLLTESAGLLVLDRGPSPSFPVVAVGSYRVHTLVYNAATLDVGSIQPGTTTAFQVESWLEQGGGTICGSLDMTGARVTVAVCPCLANAGMLTAVAPQVCLLGGQATVSATPNGDAVVPAGYQVVYLRTTGAGLLVMEMAATPSFVVGGLGDQRVQTLVHDPNTLPLSTIQVGVTTAFGVEAMLEQGGGSICGSIDMTGALVSVVDCPGCLADAGTLTANSPETCLIAGAATVSATPNGDAVVPPGYATVYLLAQGMAQLVVGLGPAPSFTLTTTGTYTVHTLVHDPATVVLGAIQVGVTRIPQVHPLLEQGGGTICGSLDMTGATTVVVECPPCAADAGTLAPPTADLCLSGGRATLSALPSGDAVVPTGYRVAFLLTEGAGLVVRDLGAAPSFTVVAPGSYRIHTLVHDPATLDLGTVQPGITAAAEILALLVRGGGTVCGDLDMTGASVTVRDCTPVNDNCPDAIELPVGLTGRCLPVAGDNTHASTDGPIPSCDVGGAGFADVWYGFNSGGNTTVTLEMDPMDLGDWAVVVYDVCGGNEVLCRVRPTGPIDVPTALNTAYRVRVYTNQRFSVGGPFTICTTGDIPSVSCVAGTVSTSAGADSVNVCLDGTPDIIAFSRAGASPEDYTFILTNETGIIITPLAGNSFDFNGLPVGTYRVWGVSHNGALTGAAPGNPMSALASTGACADITSDPVTVVVRTCVGMEDLANDRRWGLYPNPGNGDMTVWFTGQGSDVLIEVLDAGGRLVHREQGRANAEGRYPLPLADRLRPGTYLVRLSGGEDRAVARLVVQ